MKRNRLLSLFLALTLVSALPACSLFQANPTPSSQVLEEVRVAETAYLTAVTIINLRASQSGKPLSPDVKLAENLVFSYLQAAQTAAQAGDTVTVDQKLNLFNDALLKFNEQYLNQTVTPVN